MEYNQPLWIKQLKKEPTVKEQITVLSGPPQRSASPARYTGAGIDGVIQPGKMANTQVHEGEGVINANAMQNLDPGEFQAFQRSLETGNFNKPAFRSLIGLPPVQGLQTGGIVGSPLEEEKQTPQSLLSSNNNTNTSTDTTNTANSPLSIGTLGAKNISTGTNNTTTPATKSSSLLPGLNSSDSGLVMDNARGNASGKNYEPYDIFQTEVLSKAARGLQTTNANAIANAGLTGQGAANEMRQSTNQGLMENLSTNLLNRQVNKQAMMDQGANQLLNIGSQVETYNQNNKIDTGKRINTLIAGGQNIGAITSDTLLRNQIAKDMGVDPGDQAVTNELQTLYTASVDTNADTYGGDAEKLLQDYASSGRTVEEALQDKNLSRKVALSMRVDPDDAKNADKINAEITRRFEDAALNDVDRATKNIIESGVINDEIKSVTGWESDLKKMIGDLTTKGYINSDGTIKEGANVEWPWEDPDTYFKYNDFNGNEIDDSNYNTTTPIDLKDNGTMFKNSNGQAVTQADATAQWDKLGSSAKESYFKDDGSFDRESFMNKYFRTTQNKDGQAVAVTSKEAYEEKTADQGYAESIGEKIDDWSTTAVYPGDPEEGGQAGDPIGSDQFLYYDEYGNGQVALKEDGRLGYIWQQLSDKYNNGALMSTEQFKGLWTEGKGWIVDEDGVITNLDSKGTNTVTLKKANEKYSNWAPGDNMSTSEAAAISSQWEDLPADKKASETPVDFATTDMTYWNDGSGKNRWSMNGNVTEWVNKNIGKLWKDESTGRVYEVLGQNNPKSRKSTATIRFRDVETGRNVEYVNSKHGVALPQESYYG